MAETIFEYDYGNYRSCQNTFRGADNQEYYLGECSIDPGPQIEVRAQRRIVGTCSIIRLYSRTRMLFRRSWSHIREDGTDVNVLWFVKRGRLCVTLHSGYSVASSGDFMVTHSTTPFFMDCQTDEFGVLEALHVVVPTHVLRALISRQVRSGFVVPGARRHFAIAEGLFTDLLEDQGELPEHIARMLSESAFHVLNDALQGYESSPPARQTLGERHVRAILKFVETHLSNPKLSMATVAGACGISQRYLCMLLRQRGTTYSELVWQRRVLLAARLLGQARAEAGSIRAVAYRAGFKSPAHFSRMFKKVYQTTPADYRDAKGEARAHAENTQTRQACESASGQYVP